MVRRRHCGPSTWPRPDPETVTGLLLGALTRGAMLVASAPNPAVTRQAVADAVRALIAGFVR